jgi:hypothetical protein
MTLENSFILVLRGAHHKMTASTKKTKVWSNSFKGLFYMGTIKTLLCPKLYLNDTTTLIFKLPLNFFPIGWMSQKLT